MPFPTTPSQDTFERATLGSDQWANAWDDGAGMVITSGAAGGAGGFSGSYFKPGPFFNCEAYYTLDTPPSTGDEVQLWFRAFNRANGNQGNTPPLNAQDGYVFIVYPLDWGISRLVNGSSTLILAGGGATVSAGDRWGIQAIGSAISVWKKPTGAAGLWAQQGATVVDTTWQYGWLGFEFGGTTARVGEFSGGKTPVGSDTNKEWGGRGASW